MRELEGKCGGEACCKRSCSIRQQQAVNRGDSALSSAQGVIQLAASFDWTLILAASESAVAQAALYCSVAVA